MEHFGIKVCSRKYGLRLEREKYAIVNRKNSLKKFESMKEAYEDEEGKIYTEGWCRQHREKCLKNFDLNMEFYQSLKHDEFEEELKSFICKYPQFKQVSDLKKYEYRPGYYIMVLDTYCQIYIGTSANISSRIKKHWNTNKSFDRLIFPMNAVESSRLSIDSFRALDTTRIFVYITGNLYEQEDEYIEAFSEKFIANRIAGGKIPSGETAYFEIMKGIKSRDL